MAKALKTAFTTIAKAGASRCAVTPSLKQTTTKFLLQGNTPAINGISSVSRSHGTLTSLLGSSHTATKVSSNHLMAVKQKYSTEVDKEISKFLEKEIQYETSRAPKALPKISGFEITTDAADVTLSKNTGSEKVVVKLSVNGAVDSIMAEDPEKQNEPPQMVCRPPFDVEISKEDGTVLSFQCSFPTPEEPFEDAEEYAKGGQEAERIDDQFEIQEVAIHSGEWKETTFAVSAATMDAELFDLLMDMLDERGINDEFISQLVDYCTAYENTLYIGFLNKLKAIAEK